MSRLAWDDESDIDLIKADIDLIKAVPLSKAANDQDLPTKIARQLDLAAVVDAMGEVADDLSEAAVAMLRQQGELKKVWGPAAWEASAEARRIKAGFTFNNNESGILPAKPDAYHGSGQAYESGRKGDLYLTSDPKEAEQFAQGSHLGGAGNEPQVHSFYLKPGKVRDVDKEISDAMEEGDFDQGTIDRIAAEERGKAGGARYLKFTHPSVHGDDIPVLVALHPETDLEHMDSAKIGNPVAWSSMRRRAEKLAKAANDQDLPTKIARQLDLAAVVDAMGEVADDLSEAAVAAAQHTVNVLDLGDDDELTNRVNDKAVAIARKQAAMLVGRRWDEDGNLVPVKNPEYQIDETTRDGIRQLIADGLEQNIGTNAIAKSINDDFIVSEKRAGLIARSEVARVNSLSVLDSLFSARDDARVNVKKVWLTAGDDLVDDVCQENEDAGPIDLEDDFPSGDDAPLAHPFCRCVLTNVVLDDDDAEKLVKFGYVGGVKKFNPNHDERGQFASGPSAGFAAAPAPNEISILPEQQQRDHEDAEVVHEAFTKAAKDAATELHYNPDHVQVLETESPFELNGKTYQAAGRAFLNTDRIVIYHPPSSYMTPQQVPALMAHEVMHQKYHAYLQAVRAESEKVQALPKNSVPVQVDTGTDTPRTVMRDAMKPDGTLRPPYDKQFPLYQADAELKRNWEKMEKEDGLTEYSRDWWQATKSGGATFESAYHETLAEMARLDYETKQDAAANPELFTGIKPKLPAPSEVKEVSGGLASTGKPSKDWLRLYKAVNKHWEKVRS